jgi:DNA-binding PadR family transcriptional regulator
VNEDNRDVLAVLGDGVGQTTTAVVQILGGYEPPWTAETIQACLDELSAAGFIGAEAEVDARQTGEEERLPVIRYTISESGRAQLNRRAPGRRH